MTADHEQMVLEAAAAILRARGLTELADDIGRGPKQTRDAYEPPVGATVLQRRLHQALRQSGRSARSVSLEIGSPDMVRMILHGRSVDPRATNLFKLADTLGVDARWLVGLGENP